MNAALLSSKNMCWCTPQDFFDKLNEEFSFTLDAAVHENAVAHGWWEQERELPEILMLCVSELAEALEEYRAGKPNIYYNVEGEEILYADGEACEKHERRKPEGVAVELADCMIRILDYCGHAGIDIEEAIRIKHEYNKTRPYRHGGKKC